MNKKELNNKGFSLVELIIVIAIMAVLVGVLAPQFLKYVESSRVQKDESAAEELRHAVEIAIADEAIYNSLGLSSSKTTVTVTAADASTIACTDSASLITELAAVLGTSIDFTSSEHNGQTYTVTITYNSTTGAVTVTGAFA